MNISKQLKSKTNWYGALVATLPMILEQLPLLEPYLKEHYNLVFFAVGVGIIFLRNLTGQPISEK